MVNAVDKSSANELLFWALVVAVEYHVSSEGEKSAKMWRVGPPIYLLS